MSIIDSIEQFKNQYYQSQGKNTLFKKAQKLNCAKEICDTFSREDMIKSTVFIIKNTNKIVFNYNVFKLYGCPEIYESIVSYLLQLYDEVLKTYDSFEMHMLMDTFSMSAAERYKELIKHFCVESMSSTTNYSSSMSNMYMYHTPSVIESIKALFKPFIDNDLTNKMTMYSKAESAELIKNLYNSA